MESEELREALLNLERARNRERQLRIETEGLLEGLRILAQSQSTQDVFVRLLQVLKNLMSFDFVFVLQEKGAGQMSVVAFSDALFEHSQWKVDSVFNRVLSGSPVILFDILKSSEWLQQPEAISRHVRSALHVPIETFDTKAMLICASRHKAFFKKSHVDLLLRFTPLASQALQNQEISENLRLARDQAREMAKQAEEANQAKSDFLAKMSHEIRTPLNGIIGMTETALDAALDDNQRRLLSIIDNESNHLLHIINNILDFSKIESGQLEIESVPFDLRRLMNAVGENIVLQASSKGLELNVYLAPGAPQNLMGDPTRLRQVLLNLSSNALKFTEQGEICIKGEVIDHDDAQVTIEFSVEDTGIGIHPDKQNDIFRGFAQLDGSTTRKYGGTGLGTTISKQLVELMGGKIQLKSTEGKGSKFWFDLTFDIASCALEEKVNSHQWQNLRVLVVDDCNIGKKILTNYLEFRGCHVVGAADGFQALDLLMEAQGNGTLFDLLITDFRMPNMSGYELALRVRASQSFADIPIIAISGLEEIIESDDPKQMGFDKCLAKPLQIEALQRAIEEIFHRESDAKASLDTGTNRPKSKSAAGDSHILLVEDYLTNQQVAYMHLTSAGYTVEMADNGIQAVERFGQGAYNLILMDLEMPHMDGFEATKAIRRLESEHQPPQPPIPIVALTAHALKGQEEKCLRHGMNDFITKPLRRDQLLNVVSKWLHGADAGTHTVAAQDLRKGVEFEKDSASLETPMDWSTAVEEFLGDQDLLLQVIDGFQTQVKKQIKTISDALDSGDAETVRLEAHAIKGGVSNIAAHPLFKIALKLEQMGASGDLCGSKETLRGLITEVARLRLFVKNKEYCVN